MTIEEFNNLKIGDIFYTYSIYDSNITEHIVKYTGISDSQYRFILSEKLIVNETYINDYYIDENKCLIDFIKNRKAHIIDTINEAKNDLTNLNKKYSKFIKENVEHFI